MFVMRRSGPVEQPSGDWELMPFSWVMHAMYEASRNFGEVRLSNLVGE